MAFEFELPDVGEGIAEGEIVVWHVSPGDSVEEDQVIADVETDKAVVDLPAPVTGTIHELHADEGEIVPVGSVVATIDVDGDGDAVEAAAGEAVEAGETGDAAGKSQEAIEAAAGDGRVFAPPNVRRLARELGVDITTVSGTGPSGRVTDADVRAAAESESGQTEQGEPEPEQRQTKSAITRRGESAEQSTATDVGTESTASGALSAAERDRTLAVPATRRLARELGVDIDEVPTEQTRDGEAFVEEAEVRAFAEAQAAPAAATDADTPTAEASSGTGAADATDAPTGHAEPGERVTTEPYRGIRRTIGQQMEESVYSAPHAHHHDQANVSALVETRERLKPRAEAQGVRLTYMPFVLKAIVAALREYPELNAELDEENEQIIHKHYYNVGIAVATDAGLMVPVVKDVDQKGLLQLASEVSELAAKAREREITPAEMRDGTFTITNFGAFGGEYATPIINHPEAAILGLGAIEQRPVVEDGEVVAQHTLPLSLAIDHRIVDGAEAAQFCNTVKEYLETPELLLLE